VWDAATGRELADFSHPDWVSCAAVRPDGRTVISGCDDNHIRVWDVAARREVRDLTFTEAPGNRRIKAVAVSADGRMVAAAGYDRSVRVWETATWQERARPDGPAEGTLALAFTPDGRFLIAGGADHVVRVHDLATGEAPIRLPGHRGGVTSVAVAADGRTLVTGSADTTALVWETASFSKAAGRPSPVADAAAAERAWAALTSEDAAKGHRAIQALAAAPGLALPFLRERLRPVRPADPVAVAELIRRLDDDRFREREAAARDLAALREAARPALVAALAGRPSANARERLRSLVDRLDAPSPGPFEVQALRGVEALERMDGPGARELLRDLAGGLAGARLTREAEAAVRRLDRGGPAR
jgi:hypothetical protein